nr:MAG TPA: hypothetical protein [Caudoviricetes sp.]
MITVIKVPAYNDSFSRVVLSGKEYLIRFSYNCEGDYWTFGIYDGNRTPYVAGIKIVPNSPLNFFYLCHGLPEGIFGALTVQEHVGKKDFQNGNAQFVFIPLADLKEVVVNG